MTKKTINLSFFEALSVLMHEGNPLPEIPRDVAEERRQIRLFMQGDPDAFRYLYELHSGAIYNFSLKYSGDRELAEETVQDTFVRAYRYKENLKEDRSIRSYLYTIAINLLRDRKRLKRNSDLSFNALEEMHLQFSAKQRSSQRSLEMAEMEQFLETVINRLPEKQKTVLLLRKVEAMRIKEMQKILGCSVRSITRYLDAAFASILKEFEAAGYAKNGEIQW